MKVVLALMIGINILFGVKYFLNAFHVLQDSKFSQGTTVVFACISLAMAAGGFWVGLIKGNDKLALVISLAPWFLGFLLVFVSMITSDYK